MLNFMNDGDTHLRIVWDIAVASIKRQLQANSVYKDFLETI